MAAIDDFNADGERFNTWLASQGINGRIEPRPEFIRKTAADFQANHGRSPQTDAERAECYRIAQAEEVLDLYARFKEQDTA